MTDLVAALPGRIFRRDALLILVVLGSGGAAAVWAQSKADARIHTVVDAGLSPLERRVDAQQKTLDGLSDDMAAMKRQQAAKEERDAARFDLLYRTILERRAQPEAAELAQPAVAPSKDGGR